MFFNLQNIPELQSTFLVMDTEVKAETTLVEENKQPEPEKETNGEQNGKESTPADATTETKKETRTGKDSKGDSGTRPRRERERPKNRRRSRSPVVRSREDRSSKASRSVYVANFPFDVSVL